MNSRIVSYQHDNTLYTLPPEPPVLLNAERHADASAVKWLLNECDIRPVHGEYIAGEPVSKVNFAQDAQPRPV